MKDKISISDEDGKVPITDVGIFDKMTNDEALAVFDESDTPAIDSLVDKFTKGGPGSGIKGHTTAKQEKPRKAYEGLSDDSIAFLRRIRKEGKLDSIKGLSTKDIQDIYKVTLKIAEEIYGRFKLEKERNISLEHEEKVVKTLKSQAKKLGISLKRRDSMGFGSIINTTSPSGETGFIIMDYSSTRYGDKSPDHIAYRRDTGTKDSKNWKEIKRLPITPESDPQSLISTLLKSIGLEKSTNKTPAIDALIEKGGPGSGQKGHTTYHQNMEKLGMENLTPELKKRLKQIQGGKSKDMDEHKKRFKDDVILHGIELSRKDKKQEKSKFAIEMKEKIAEDKREKLSNKKSGSDKKTNITDLRKHSQYTSSDYSALKKKGYTDKEISGIWDKDKKSGKKPLHRKEIPKMDESIKAKKISERLKSESTSKTPAIDKLIAKGGPGSGIKGHTTAKELAIKKKFGELDKARNKTDALAEKDIRDGQRMIDKAAKERKAVLEETLELGAGGSEIQYRKLVRKNKKIDQQEKIGWNLGMKGQNRKVEISNKYNEAAKKLMGTEGEIGTIEESKVTSHEDSMIKVENIIKEIFPKYPLDYSGDLITVGTLGKGNAILNAYIPTGDEGTNPQYGEPSKKELQSYEDKWKPAMARLQNALRIKGFRDMKVTLDYGEKGHIGLEVFGTLEKVKPLEDEPSGKEQPTLTRDAPKHIPKSNLLATKHAEAAVKRGTLFKELGKKSKKELKDMIQQDSKVDMAGSLKQMTKSDMKYHITSGKYPSPKGSEEAYNALTKQERKGLLKLIPDPKTPKAKGSEPPKRRNAPSIKAIQVEGVDAYQSTHGKKPRGTGLWMFQIGEDSGNTYSAETSFKEAQKQAKKQAQKEMKWSVKLLP